MSSGVDLEHRYLITKGVRLHYVVAGAGPLVLFVHGLPQCWYAWRRVIEELRGEVMAVAHDIRGFHESSPPASWNETGVLPSVGDVLALRERLGAGQLVLVGHDIGAAIGWSFALHHPQLLAGLITIGGAHPALFDRELHQNPEQQRASRHWLALRRATAAQAFRADNFALLRGIFAGNDFFSAEDQQWYLDAWRRPGALDGMLAWCRREGWGPPEDGTPARGNYVPEVTPLTTDIPVLALYGDRDRFILPGCYDGLDRYATHLQTECIEGATHWLPEERPIVVADHIRAFVRRLCIS